MTPLPYLWRSESKNKYCVLESLANVPRAHEIAFGKPRLANFPTNAHYRMNNEFKKQIALADNLWGPGGDRVISKRLKEFIEACQPKDTEFLPVSIIDHKGRVASSDYYILHPVAVVDCIDQQQSVLKWNPINPDAISSCRQLVFDLKRIPKGTVLWRPRHLEHDVFVQRTLADDIVSQGFTGVSFEELEEYGG